MQQLFLNAVNLHQSGQFLQAESLYRQVLAKFPRHPDVLNALGMLYQHTGRFSESCHFLEKAIQFRQDAPHLYVNLAESCRLSGDTKTAIKWGEKALKLNGRNADAEFVLGSAFHDAGRIDRAVECYRNALKNRPDFPEAHNSLGSALEETGYSEDAKLHFKKALQLAPQFAAAHLNLARLHKKLGDFPEAQEHYKLAIACGDVSISTRLSIAELWVEMQEYGRAEPYYAEVIRTDSTNVQALNGLGLCAMLRGERQEAEVYFEQALSIDPSFIASLVNLSHNRKFSSAEDPVITRIQLCLADAATDVEARAGLHYALGKALDDCASYDQAFLSYAEGAKLTHQQVGKSISEYQVEFAKIKEIYTPELLSRVKQMGGNSSGLPVFVVGMPRSGTSLTEQIIASHPNAVGVGELMLMSNIEHRLSQRLDMPYPDCLTALTLEEIENQSSWYLAGLKHFSNEVECHRIVDKMPHNFLRLGLISILFPNAKIIHCRRDAMDNCLSIFFQKFVGNGHKYSYELTTLGQYYRLYEDLMAYWREALPAQILDIDYEATTADPEAISRKLIEFVGLEWDDACLTPHKLERTVKTASQWQVRQPIYKTSVQRWRHYEKHLGPLKVALGLE